MLNFLCVRLQTRFSRLSVCHSVRDRVSVRGYYYFYLERESERASERARERERSNANTNICMSNYLSSATVRSFFRLCEALQYFWAKTFNILPSSIPLKLERNTLWRRCN